MAMVWWRVGASVPPMRQEPPPRIFLYSNRPHPPTHPRKKKNLKSRYASTLELTVTARAHTHMYFALTFPPPPSTK